MQWLAHDSFLLRKAIWGRVCDEKTALVLHEMPAYYSVAFDPFVPYVNKFALQIEFRKVCFYMQIECMFDNLVGMNRFEAVGMMGMRNKVVLKVQGKRNTESGQFFVTHQYYARELFVNRYDLDPKWGYMLPFTAKHLSSLCDVNGEMKDRMSQADIAQMAGNVVVPALRRLGPNVELALVEKVCRRFVDNQRGSRNAKQKKRGFGSV
jgi:hypothetical protein